MLTARTMPSTAWRSPLPSNRADLEQSNFTTLGGILSGELKPVSAIGTVIKVLGIACSTGPQCFEFLRLSFSSSAPYLSS